MFRNSQHIIKKSNNKRRVYFLFGVPLESLYQAIAADLSRHYGFTEFCGLVWGRSQLCFLDKREVNWSRVEIISDHIRQTLPSVKLDLDYLRSAEQKYGMPNFGLMICSDRWFGKKPYQWILRFLQMSIQLVERMYEETQPDIVVIDPVADLMSYLHYAIAVKKNIPCYSMSSGRILDRFALCNNPYQLWQRVDELFKRKLQHLLIPEELARAEMFLKKFQQEKNYKLINQSNYLSLNFVKHQILGIARSIKNYLADPFNPIPLRPPQLIAAKFNRIIRLVMIQIFHYFEKPVAGEKYILYPLHFEPEAATLILAPYFTDQLSLIENISRSLPVGYKLYVKEHPVSVGRRSFFYYNRIRCLYNVRLIHPSSEVPSLIKNAAAVATISGTIGWEALLLGKTVITFGQVCYNSYPLVVQARLQPMEKWPEMFLGALKNNESYNKELLLKYISAVLEGTFPGIVGDAINSPKVLESENIRKICDALALVLGISGKE